MISPNYRELVIEFFDTESMTGSFEVDSDVADETCVFVGANEICNCFFWSGRWEAFDKDDILVVPTAFDIANVGTLRLAAHLHSECVRRSVKVAHLIKVRCRGACDNDIVILMRNTLVGELLGICAQPCGLYVIGRSDGCGREPIDPRRGTLYLTSLE